MGVTAVYMGAHRTAHGPAGLRAQIGRQIRFEVAGQIDLRASQIVSLAVIDEIVLPADAELIWGKTRSEVARTGLGTVSP